MNLADEILNKKEIIEKYLVKRRLLGLNYEIFGIYIDKTLKSNEIVKIALIRGIEGNDNIRTYKIPDFVDTVGNKMFREYLGIINGGIDTSLNNFYKVIGDSIEEVTIGKNVTEIQQYVFSNSNISKVNINGKISSVGNSAFSECSKLKHFDFDKFYDAEIEPNAFTGCTSIESADLRNVVSIGSCAFSMCKKLKNIKLSEKLIRLEYKCFYDCDLREIVIPDNIHKIQNDTFGMNNNIEFIKFGTGIRFLSECSVDIHNEITVELNSRLGKDNYWGGYSFFNNGKITVRCNKEIASILKYYKLRCKIELID